MGKKKRARAVTAYWHAHFVSNGLCGLCANSGTVDTRPTAISAAGVRSGGEFWCICPNGQAIRAAMERLNG